MQPAGREPRDAAVPLRLQPASRHPVCFCFSGLGGEYSDMGLGLYRGDDGFRTVFDEIAQLFASRAAVRLQDYLFDRSTFERHHGELLYSSAAIFTTQMALVRMWEERGVVPASVLAHSFGGYAAACTAGAIMVGEAVDLVVARCDAIRLTCKVSALVAVRCKATAVARLLTKDRIDADIAALNGPNVTIVAVCGCDLALFTRALRTKEIDHKVIPTGYGFHTRRVDPALPAIEAATRRLGRRIPKIPVISTSSVRFAEIDSLFFRTQLREPIDLCRTLALPELQPAKVIEIGPDDTLCRRFGDCGEPEFSFVPSLRGALEPIVESERS